MIIFVTIGSDQYNVILDSSCTFPGWVQYNQCQNVKWLLFRILLNWMGIVTSFDLSDAFHNKPPCLLPLLRGGHGMWVTCVSTVSLTWLQWAAGVWEKCNSLRLGDAYLQQWTGYHCWLVACPAPIPHLNEWWIIVRWALKNKDQWSFNQ